MAFETAHLCQIRQFNVSDLTHYPNYVVQLVCPVHSEILKQIFKVRTDWSGCDAFQL